MSTYEATTEDWSDWSLQIILLLLRFSEDPEEQIRWVFDDNFGIIMSPHPTPTTKGERAHIAFGVDPISLCIASCLHSISWTNGWILTKLAQTHYWMGEEVIRFWWPWPHFQGHTSTLKFSNFDQKMLFCTLSLEPNDRFWPNFIYCNIGTVLKIWLDLGYHDLIFKVNTL